jgi:hypothetical protein
MPTPAIGTPVAGTTAASVLSSIRDMIPDQVTDPSQDGTAFTLASLLRWMNDGLRIMATTAPIIQDWYALQSTQGMDLYVLPSTTLSVEQLWYDNFVCVRAPEYSNLGLTKITSRSYFFGPHSIHQTPRLALYPACDRTGAVTTLATSIDAAAVVISLTSTAGFRPYGYLDIDGEIIAYRTVTTAPVGLAAILRGQAGTTAVSHLSGAVATERNVMMKVSRLPTPLTSATDLVEIPVGLTPLIEVYVLSKVREAEQDHGTASRLRQEFTEAMRALETKNPVPGLRQGLQVRSATDGPVLWYGRVVVP